MQDLIRILQNRTSSLNSCKTNTCLKCASGFTGTKGVRHTCKRADRGVHQAGFLVLKASAMPSILVELGFISNPEEERYLNSEAGRTTLANGIFRLSCPINVNTKYV